MELNDQKIYNYTLGGGGEWTILSAIYEYI